MERCLLKEAKVNRTFWPEIIKAAAYLKNRTLAKTIERKSPYEIFFETKPSVKYLKLYGSSVIVRLPEQLRRSKWDDKARLGILLGYTDTGHRVLINNRIINARHVDVLEEGVRYVGLAEDNNDIHDDDENELSQNENESENYQSLESEEVEYRDKQNKRGPILDGNKVTTESKGNHSELRHSSRSHVPNKRFFNDEYATNFIYVNYCDANVPNTFEEAIESQESQEWKKAMKSEMDSLARNETWKLVNRPKHRQVIDVKWIYKKEDENIYKARLVARGFQQRNQMENVY